MDQKQLNIGVIFGGMSAEHEVSWQSARNIIQAMDPAKYQAVPIFVDKQGNWYQVDSEILDTNDIRSLPVPKSHLEKNRILLDCEDGQLFLFHPARAARSCRLDAVFPIIHGPFGEDGTLQGLCKLYQVPFVGPGVLASAVCMDKEMTKRLLTEAGIPGAKFLVVRKEAPAIAPEEIIKGLGLPLFVKPANLGSSVGISKANSPQALAQALTRVWRFDNKAIVEEYIAGREIECSVLGNQDPIASIPGEIIPQDEFYSYQAKYLDPEGAILKIPADLSSEEIEKIQDMAVRSFKALACEGMARVDFFLCPDGSVFVNELNTIPGFTNISMYPKLWEAGGLPCRELVDRLIQLAIERFDREAMNSCNWDEVPAKEDEGLE